MSCSHSEHNHEHKHKESHVHEHDMNGHESCSCLHEKHKHNEHESCACHQEEHEHHHEHSHEKCCCGHVHGEGCKNGRFSDEQKLVIARCIISAFMLCACTLVSHFFEMPLLLKLCIFLVPYFIIGYDVLIEVVQNILHGEIFDENFLMGIATIGALCLGEYPEAVFVMLFAQIGELFEDYAVDKSRSSISNLMNMRDDSANLEKDGSISAVPLEEIHIGDVIVVRAGEKIPLDGVIIEGESDFDTKALTGESVPQHIELGGYVLSGCVNLTGVIKIRVEKELKESTVSKILELVENAAEKKTKTESFITRFAHWYTPVVVCMAFLITLVPLLLGIGSPGEWVHRSLVFLIVSCPCALVISVPMGFFAGIGAASKKGILVKGSCYLEALAGLEVAVFDKTGTLTKGSFKVSEIHAVDSDKNALLRLAALAESASNHPVALSVFNAWKETDKGEKENDVQNIKEFAGLGVEAVIDGKTVHCGNSFYMEKLGIKVDEKQDGTLIYVEENGIYKGVIVIADEIKPQSKKALKALKKSGVKKIVMLSGDAHHVVKNVAENLEIEHYKANLLPGEKLEYIEKLFEEIDGNGKNKKGSIAFVGDGINDAPVLNRVDVGVAMGALGSDAAIEAADVVLMDDNPEKMAESVRIARKTISVVNQNIWFALGVKAAVLVFGVLGFAPLWAAVFADVGVLVLAVANSMRASV